MYDQLTTKDICSNSEYYSSSKDFFLNFKKSWKEVTSQVLKLETRQTYIERGNPSYELLIEGKFEDAINLLPELRKADDALYLMLKEKGVDFLRCRPVEFPLSSYLKWEFECYRLNNQKGESIFCNENPEAFSLLNKYAFHDFMVFDTFVAYIHDYDEDGEIQGGWVVKNKDHISMLIHLYSLIKATAIEFNKFKALHNLS